MEKPELTMEDIVMLVNSCEHDFIIEVEFGEEDVDGEKKEYLQT